MPRPSVGERVTTRLPADLLRRVDAAAARWAQSRAEWLRDAAREAVSIQAPRYTERRRRSPTELARIVARDSGWQWGPDDTLLDDGGQLVAFTIEDAAVAMQELGWFAPEAAGLAWGAIPHLFAGAERTDAIRQHLDTAGRHPSVNGNYR